MSLYVHCAQWTADTIATVIRCCTGKQGSCVFPVLRVLLYLADYIGYMAVPYAFGMPRAWRAYQEGKRSRA